MLLEIVFTACLSHSLAQCEIKKIRTEFYDNIHWCMMRSQADIAEWLVNHPKWSLPKSNRIKCEVVPEDDKKKVPI